MQHIIQLSVCQHSESSHKNSRADAPKTKTALKLPSFFDPL